MDKKELVEKKIFVRPEVKVVKVAGARALAYSCTCEGVYCDSDCDSYICSCDSEKCFATGTKITMADGTVKRIDDIVEGDVIRTFDHEAGEFSASKVCLMYKGDSKENALLLQFASGRTLSIVGTHDILLEDTRKYVRINSENVDGYVGKGFYNAQMKGWDALAGYEMSEEKVEFYCIYTESHLNCIAEGMLTVPDDIDYILNIYELDANLKADADQLAADIAKYGLLDVERDYPEYAQYKELMEALMCKYQNIAYGKGLICDDDLAYARGYWNTNASAA